MTSSPTSTDFTDWDWLPSAAEEIGSYLERLLTENAIVAHAVSARHKSISSFQRKCSEKRYPNPRQQVTDTVAVRIITYSTTDQNRAVECVRDRFEIKEALNPGSTKSEERRGYDCEHLVVSGENPNVSSSWLVENGHLARYFHSFGGLEIQVRTVASHAWAEFEHSRRYKGQSYKEVTDRDRSALDQLFGAAADARHALDATFTAIDLILANPSSTDNQSLPTPEAEAKNDSEASNLDSNTPIDAVNLRSYLESRFPEDNDGSDKGLEFGCNLITACDVHSIEHLDVILKQIDSVKVKLLMDYSTPVTRVRRLDDELLARFGDRYITTTATVGTTGGRKKQLEWRFDRLRGKVTVGS